MMFKPLASMIVYDIEVVRGGLDVGMALHCEKETVVNILLMVSDVYCCFDGCAPSY